MKAKYIIIATLIIFTVIIFAPPIIHGYVYPNNGDDSGNHMTYIKELAEGGTPKYTYIGQYLLGKVLIGINQLVGFDLNVMFLWLNYLALWLVGIVFYVLAGSLTGWLNGLIVLPIVIFISPSLLNLYDDGSIFDLVTVAILTPLLVYTLARLWGANKRVKLIGIPVLLVILALAVGLHSSAIFQYGFGNDDVVMPNVDYFLFLLGYSMIALIIVLVWNYFMAKPNLNVTLKTIFIIFGVVAIGLAVFSFIRITIIPLRFAVDLAIIITLATALGTAVILKYGTSKLVKYGLVGLIILASIPNLIGYWNYNSAIKPVDKKAIAYINQLEGEYFSCSEEVAPWVYSPYLNKNYQEGTFPYITRSQPMTANSTRGTKFNWRLRYGEVEPIGTVKQVFEDNGIVVEVYVQ